jgi:hypothetical protein
MPSENATALLGRFVTGDERAIAALVESSRTSDDPLVLVAAALFAVDGDGLLARAESIAATTRDRQLVAIATAHRRGERELVDALARDHLVDHPASFLVAWIADASHNQTSNKEDGPCAPESPHSY